MTDVDGDGDDVDDGVETRFHLICPIDPNREHAV